MTAIRCLQSAAVLSALALLVASCSTDPDRAKREYVKAFRRGLERCDVRPEELPLSGADLSTVESLV